jgi:hypothetical protein
MVRVPFADGGITRIRRETKILLEPDEAGRIADLLAAEATPYECRVACVYLDTPDGKLARRARASPEDCVKIRTRTYDPDLGREPGRVALDVKRERGGLTSKDRLWVAPEEVAEKVRRWLVPTFGALAPSVASSYRRRVFQSSPDWRATLDDELSFHPADWSLFAPGNRPSPASLPPAFASERLVVLELKHAPGTLPEWLDGIGRALARPYSKFAAGSLDAERAGSSGA